MIAVHGKTAEITALSQAEPLTVGRIRPRHATGMRGRFEGVPDMRVPPSILACVHFWRSARALLMAMKVKPSPPVLTCVAVFPDQMQFDCPACNLTHQVMRGLDYSESPDGVWRMHEAAGFECDCGVLIHADFTVTLALKGNP